MKRPITKKAGDQYPLAAMDPKAFEKATATRAFLLDATYVEDGSERQQGQMLFRPEPGRWCVTLKEPTSCLMVFLAAPTWADLMRLIESALGDPDTPWVKDDWAASRKPGARKK